MIHLDRKAALVVVDVQMGFNDLAYWGKRNNPACEANIGALLDAWEATKRPIVLVRHDSVSPESPLRPGHPGNRFKPEVEGRRHDLLVSKVVHSSFHGTPDLHAWLKGERITQVVVAGITTNMCCETTSRVASDLGYDLLFAVDATHAFDLKAPDGTVVTADELTRATMATLHADFGRIAKTADLVAEAYAYAGATSA
ncbi:cysteine hydrolase family protein [Pendulispora albinea]|uniref:Cysteine hydrolase n=1 Tax=Pendulispora albinea TaxID=2741071 RepID=A0ABZ2LXZ4_9BACT